MKHQIPKPFIIYANYEPGLTLTYFIARSILFFMGKCDNGLILWKLLPPVTTWDEVKIVN